MYFFGAGTHFGAGVMSAFVFPSGAIARVPTSTFIDLNSMVVNRAVILVLESIPIIGVSIIANYWIIGSMKF